MSKEKKLSKEQLLDWLDLWIDAVPRSKQAYEQIKSLIEYADQIETTYANMADEIESLSQAKEEPSKAELGEFVEKLVTKHWNPNWHDSRTIKGEVEWIMKFADELRRG